MSFLHHVFVGHFEHEGAFVRFAHSATDPILKPVVRRPLDLEQVQHVAREAGLTTANHSLGSDNDEIWLDDGYLVCDRYGLGPKALDFLRRLVQATNCEVVDFNARATIPLNELIPAHTAPETETLSVAPSHP